MLKKRNEIGCIGGKPYCLRFDKRVNILVCDDQYKKEYRWFGWCDSEYVGDFRTKSEAIAAIKEFSELVCIS